MAQIDDSFNAQGQTIVAFETLSVGDRAIGVGVNGTDCGVHGEGMENPLGTRNVPTGTGVHGRGDIAGVVGNGRSVAGVYGQHQASGAGVIGVGILTPILTEILGVTGVMGASIDIRRSEQKDRNPGNGIGVVGASNSVKGFGIVGLSVESFTETPLNNVRIPLLELKNADGDGTGVMGASGKGTGVHGSSDQGHGGVFNSNSGAQVNLKPQFETATPPFEGQAGDLLVITTMKEDKPTDGSADLWFCIRENANNEGAIWGKVQFSSTFQARQ
jgi:hypothetical protein